MVEDVANVTMLQFVSLIRDTEGPHLKHLHSHLTVFAPSNQGLEAYTGPKDSNFILNHFGEWIARVAREQPLT